MVLFFCKKIEKMSVKTDTYVSVFFIAQKNHRKRKGELIMMKLDSFWGTINSKQEGLSEHRYKVMCKLLLKRDEDSLNDVTYEELRDLLANLPEVINHMEDISRLSDRITDMVQKAKPVVRRRVM